MYVCVCTGVTDGQIRTLVREGGCSLEEVMSCTGAGTRCGSCVKTVAELVLEHAVEDEAHSSRRSLVVIRTVNSAA